MRICPSNIRFSHDSISHRFSCGRFIDDTRDELLSGRIDVKDIPKMVVARVSGLWFARSGNRRLWVFQILEQQGLLHTIDVQVTDDHIPRRFFTTKNFGVSVRVRGPVRPIKVDTSSGWSSCSDESLFMVASLYNARIQQSLLDSFDPDSGSDAVALNQDESGYFLFRPDSDGRWKYFNMPAALDHAIHEEDSRGNDPSMLACGSDGRYYISFEDGKQCWSAPRSFTKAVRQGPALEAVAFSPDGGYWLRRVDGSATWLRLPSSLHYELSKSTTPPESVSISPDGGWFVRFPDGDWRYDDIPHECHKCIKHEEREGHELVQITFGGYGEWVAVFREAD